MKRTIIIKLKERQLKTGKKSHARHPNFNLREIALQGLYQIDLGSTPLNEVLELRWVHSKLNEEDKSFVEDIIEGVTELEFDIDEVIQKYSKKDIRQISSVVRCILRMGTYEILKGEFLGPIIIDTCCTLTRKYDDERAVKFVNAILDKVYKFLLENQEEEKKEI
jgi:transcription antitermination factor NusB